jgi:hypothetical protein
MVIIPESSREDKSFMEEVETGVQDILFTSILESHIVEGRAGLQTDSGFARNPHRYDVALWEIFWGQPFLETLTQIISTSTCAIPTYDHEHGFSLDGPFPPPTTSKLKNARL